MRRLKIGYGLIQLGILTAFVSLMVSCGFNWTPVDRINSMVWSEDGQRIAYTRLAYEERNPLIPLSGTTDKRNFRYSLYHAAPDGSDQVTVVKDRSSLVGQLWYMKAANYILIYEYAERGSDARFVRYKLSDNSRATVVVDQWVGGNESVQVLPSPTGDIFVQFLPTAWCPAANDYRMDCSYSIDYLTGGSYPHKARVRFFDADTLATLEQGTGDLETEIEFNEYLRASFVLDGSFVVSDIFSDSAWSFAPGRGPMELLELPVWECITRAPSSNNVNAMGEQLIIADNGQSFSIMQAEPGDDYGCDE